MNKKLTRCIQIAKCLQPTKQNGRAFHISIAYLKNKIVGMAWNSYEHEHLEHLFGEYKVTRGNPENYKAGRHSESELLRRIKIPLKNISIFNVRVDNNGNEAMAKACANCEKLLRKNGLKRLVYTIAPNEYGILES